MSSDHGGLHPLKPRARRNPPSPQFLLSDIWPQREFCLFLGSPLRVAVLTLSSTHRTPSKHVGLLSACCFLRLSMLSHTVLTCWHHSCAGCSSMGLSSRESYKQLYTLEKKTVSSYTLIRLESPSHELRNSWHFDHNRYLDTNRRRKKKLA